MSKEALSVEDTLKLALEALDNLMYWDNGKPDYDEAREAIAAIKEALAQPEQSTTCGEPDRRCCPHDHDCAVHNMPAYPAGPCDCTYKDTHNLPPSEKVHEICLALLKREVDRRVEDNFGRCPNDSWSNKVLDVYHFFNSNPKAKKLTVIYTTPYVATPRPQRTAIARKPLTDEQIKEITLQIGWTQLSADDLKFCRAIEAVHGIKGDA